MKKQNLLFSFSCLLNLFLPSEKQKNLHRSDVFSKTHGSLSWSQFLAFQLPFYHHPEKKKKRKEGKRQGEGSGKDTALEESSFQPALAY